MIPQDIDPRDSSRYNAEEYIATGVGVRPYLLQVSIPPIQSLDDPNLDQVHRNAYSDHHLFSPVHIVQSPGLQRAVAYEAAATHVKDTGG